MDIDPNFHESESLFYESLNHIKKEDEASDEEQEQTAQEQSKGPDVKEQEPEDQKPVKFLERPKEVLQHYQNYDDALSEEDDEDGLLNTLQEQMGLVKKEQPDKHMGENPAGNGAEGPQESGTEAGESSGLNTEKEEVKAGQSNELSKEKEESKLDDANLDDLLDDLL